MPNLITCPHCSKKFELDEVMSHQIDESVRLKVEKKIKSERTKIENDIRVTLEEEKKEEFTKKTQKLLEEKRQQDKTIKDLLSQQADLNSKIKDFDKEKTDLITKTREATEQKYTFEITDLKSQVLELNDEREKFRDEKLKLSKRERELTEKEKNSEIEFNKKIAEESIKIHNEAKEKVSQEYELKLGEEKIRSEGLLKQIDELKKRAEQGSQQLQGEALEVALEEHLKVNFPSDEIFEVAKGQPGGDVIQKISFPNGQSTIIWESKNTKNWQDAWIDKLKQDQRTIKAEAAIIVSKVLPKGISRFGLVNGVWVTDFESSIGLAIALRESLFQISKAQIANVGKSQKMEVMYNYLTGHEFSQRVQAIVETFQSMRNSLMKEKDAMAAIWNNREKQIQIVIQNTAGMYGDIGGIIGANLPEIEVLELPHGSQEKK